MENFYELSRVLLEHRRDYFLSEFTDNSTSDYFEKSLNDIHLFLSSKYDSDYLFVSLAYSHDGRIKALPYKFNPAAFRSDSSDDSGEYAKELIDYLTQILVNERNHLSFTQMMMSEKNHERPIKILLHTGMTNEEMSQYKPYDEVQFDLSKAKWEPIGSLDKFKVHDFLGHDYGLSIHEEFVHSYGNPFIKMAGSQIPTNLLEEFNRLISIYLEFISQIKGPNFFYFIKPHSSHTEFSGVLLLGLKKKMPIADFTLWVHGIYRLLSEISIKKIQRLAEQEQDLRYQAKSNLTVHFFKTMIKGLIHSPLISLVNKYDNDSEVDNIRENAELILELSSVINLIAKISEGLPVSKDELLKSNLFSESNEPIDLAWLFSTIEKREDDRGFTIEILGKECLKHLFPMIKYQGLFARKEFYLFYFLTLVENAFENGVPEYGTGKITITLEFNSESREFLASNTGRKSSQLPLMKDVKGNIKLFNVILELTKIGSIEFRKSLVNSVDYFETVLMLKPKEYDE